MENKKTFLYELHLALKKKLKHDSFLRILHGHGVSDLNKKI